jgi:hypothetical protein
MQSINVMSITCYPQGKRLGLGSGANDVVPALRSGANDVVKDQQRQVVNVARKCPGILIFRQLHLLEICISRCMTALFQKFSCLECLILFHHL